MVVTIHSTPASPPCRAVLLTAAAVGAPISIKDVDLLGGGTKAPEYVKLNPQHSVPTLVDNGLVIAESRAMMEYLSDAYGKNDALHPRNVKKRAVVNARLYFDATTLYPRIGAIYLKPLFSGIPATDADKASLDDAVEILNTHIGENLYVAGDKLTIADISIAVSLSNAVVCGYDLQQYKNVSRWFNNAKKVIPQYEEINQTGANFIGAFYQKKFGGSTEAEAE